jgi:hypothetical protein
MKYLINESNLASIETRIYKSINKVGLYETLRRYKLPFKLANIIISPENEEYFTCSEMSQIFYYYLFDTHEIPKEVRYENFKIITTPEPSSSMSTDFYMNTEIEIDGVTRKYLAGFGQPFYCVPGNTVVSLEYNYYIEGNFGEPNYFEVETTGKYFSDMWLAFDLRFKTLTQVLEWYLKEYPKMIANSANKILDEIDKYLDQRALPF